MTLTPTHEENGSTFYDTIATVNAQSKFRATEYRLSVDGPSGGYWQAADSVGPLTIGATYHFRLKSKPKQKADGYYQDIVKAAPADGAAIAGPAASAAPRGGGNQPPAFAAGGDPQRASIERQVAGKMLTEVACALIARGADDWGVWDEVWARWKSAYRTLWGDAAPAPAAQPAPAGDGSGGPYPPFAPMPARDSSLPPEVAEGLRQGYGDVEPPEDGESLPW